MGDLDTDGRTMTKRRSLYVIRNIDIGDDNDMVKANPYTGSEVSRRLRLPDLKTVSPWRW